MPKAAGSYRKMLLEQQKNRSSMKHTNDIHEEEPSFLWLRIRFYIALVLFVCYVLLDYSGLAFQRITSESILGVIQEDLSADLDPKELLAELTDQIIINKEK